MLKSTLRPFVISRYKNRLDVTRFPIVEIDASYGEGGGQILRTALTLSVLTRTPTHLRNIRAGRRNPGLAPQHLTTVRALAEIARAEVREDRLKSTELLFQPRSAPLSGNYTFDVSQSAQGGSAGSVSLIFQALLLPLCFTQGDSCLNLVGGTHVAWSPPYDYLESVYLPTLAKMGLKVNCNLERWGFYPAGGGRMLAEIRGIQPPGEIRSLADGGNKSSRSDIHVTHILVPLRLTERGELNGIRGRAVASNLPAHIPQRMANRARNLLAERGITARIEPLRVRGAGPGAGIFLTAQYEHTLTGFSSIGERGKPSEKVAQDAVDLFLAHDNHEAAVDRYLADQLLLPMALAGGRSEMMVSEITQHLLTNAHIIRQFTKAQITIQGKKGEPGYVVVEGIGYFSL
jgi:RNA 3'-terminal phosphate cyclase (ATP)